MFNNNYEQMMLFRACVIIMCVYCFAVVLTDLLKDSSVNIIMTTTGALLLFVAMDLEK